MVYFEVSRILTKLNIESLHYARHDRSSRAAVPGRDGPGYVWPTWALSLVFRKANTTPYNFRNGETCQASVPAIIHAHSEECPELPKYYLLCTL